MSAAVETAPKLPHRYLLLCRRCIPAGRVCMAERTGEEGKRKHPSPIQLPQPISGYCLLIWFWTSVVGLFQALPPTIQRVCDNLDSIIAGLCSFFRLLLRRQHTSMLLSQRKDYFLTLTAVLGDKAGFWPLLTHWSGVKQYLIPPSVRTNEPRVNQASSSCPAAFHLLPPF